MTFEIIKFYDKTSRIQNRKENAKTKGGGSR